jgi:uncharacterized protein YggU (UPF0235/DUF167 family)
LRLPAAVRESVVEQNAVVLHIAVHVQPGAKVARVGGSYDGVLQVAVRARAVEGAATEDAERVIADAFSVRPRAVTCVRGQRSRQKLLAIDGDPELLAAIHADLLAQDR